MVNTPTEEVVNPVIGTSGLVIVISGWYVDPGKTGIFILLKSE